MISWLLTGAMRKSAMRKDGRTKTLLACCITSSKTQPPEQLQHTLKNTLMKHTDFNTTPNAMQSSVTSPNGRVNKKQARRAYKMAKRHAKTKSPLG